MKTFIKLIALGTLTGVLLSGVGASATESTDAAEDNETAIDYSTITYELPSKVFEKMEAKVFESSDGLNLPYRIYYSPAYNAEDKKNPATVFVFLHGSGGVGNNNEQQIRDQVATVNYLVSDTADAALAGVPYIVIAPQCPAGSQWVNTPYAKGSYSIDEIPISAPLNAVYELIQATLTQDNADPNNVMLGGISMGGYGTWDSALRHPELFAAVFPICGSGDPSKAANLAGVKVWTFHSDNDASVPVEGTRQMVAALEQAGVDVNYTEFTGKGHNAWGPAMTEVTDPYLLEWLFEDCRYYTVKLLVKRGLAESTTVIKLRKGDTLVEEIEPLMGYIPESFVVNGEEKALVADENGDYYLECDITADTVIEVTCAADGTEESSEEAVAPENSEDVVAPENSEDVVAPESSEEAVAPENSEDVVAPESSEETSIVETETSETEESKTEGEGKKSLSNAAKIGIGIGTAALIGACIGIIVASKKKKK